MSNQAKFTIAARRSLTSVQSLVGINPAEYMTGHLFVLPCGAVWRVRNKSHGKHDLYRITNASTGELKTGEERWVK